MGEKNKGFGIVVLMSLGIFVCMIDTTIMNIALPAIQNSLHVSLETMSWMLNVYTISIAVLSIPLARVAEVYGKGKFFILGSLLFGVGSALCGLATTGGFLIASRFVQSVGAAILMPVSTIIGVSAVPVQKRHLAQGLLGSTQGLAAALGPTVGGIITQTIGWSWVFYVNVPICLVSIVLGLYRLDMSSDMGRKVKIDLLGFLLSGLCIFSLTLVLVKGNTWGWNSLIAVCCYISTVVLLVAFLLVERKVEDPLVNLALFRHRQFTGATLAMVASTVYMVAVTVLLPQFLTHFQGKSEIQASWLITPVSATIFFIAPFSGILARKFGSFVLILLGFLSLGASYYLLEKLALDVSSLQVIVISILLGAGFGFVIGPATTASASNFEKEMLTSSQSVTQMFRQVGVVLAVAISISGLTHYLSAQKEEVLKYTVTRAQTLNLPNSLKQVAITQAQQTVNSPDAGEGETSSTHVTSSHATAGKSGQPVDPAVVAQISQYSRDVSQFAKRSMALAFAKLYHSGFPVVLGSLLIALLFVRRNLLGKAEITAQQGLS